MEKPFKKLKDKGKRHAPYWFRYTDENGKRRMGKGFTDKAETARLQAKLQHEADLRRRGLIDSKKEAMVASERTAITEHLAAFAESLKDNPQKHVKLVTGRVKRLLSSCGFNTPADIDVEKVKVDLRRLVDEEGLSLRTRNHYMQAFKEFCSWLVVDGRMYQNPVLGLKSVNSEVAIKHQRRALTPSEVARLVEAADSSTKSVVRYDGKTRGRIYRTAYATGLRRNEIASLTPESFNFEDKTPTVTVEAAFSKHRKKDVLPLHPDYAAIVREWLIDAAPGEPIFPSLAKRRTERMIRHDLTAAGIPYKSPEGFADFHSLRHSHVTELIKTGASLPVSQALARHTDIRTTMKYTHTGLHDQAEAVTRLTLPPNGSSRRGPTGREVSSQDSSETAQDVIGNELTTSEDGRYVTLGHPMPSPVTTPKNTRNGVRFPPPPLELID